MKIPILVLTLVLIYGTYTICAEESTNLIKKGPNDGNYLLNFSNTPLEKSLSRNKRDLLLPQIVKIISQLIKLGNNIIFKNILDFASFVISLLNGRDVCPKEAKLSFDLIDKIIFYPIEAFKTIICYFLQIITSETFKLINKSLEYFLSLLSQFIRKVFLPGLHKVLNVIADTGLLPPSLQALVDAFNVLYKILKIIGYIQ